MADHQADPAAEESARIEEAINATEHALATVEGDAAAVAAAALAAVPTGYEVPNPPPAFHEHPMTSPRPEPQAQAPPSPRGLKRIAEEAIEASSPGHIAAHREQVVRNRKRLCRYPGCTKVIKSQGHCQRHGAKAKRCKVEGCDKQAQGTHDGEQVGKVILWIMFWSLLMLCLRFLKIRNVQEALEGY